MTETFQRQLEDYSGKKLKLRINDNRSTFLSVRWNPDHTLVSMHRMFLEAPQNIMEALACYLAKPRSVLSPVLKAFIESGARLLDYSSNLDPSRLETKGKVHDLQKLFDLVNSTYFNNTSELKICWYGVRQPRGRTRIGLGYYHHPLKLVKINRVLDQLEVPDYVVAFVIYHEILHYQVPPIVNDAGRTRIHHSQFREQEKLFHDYQRAQQWVHQHRALFFVDV